MNPKKRTSPKKILLTITTFFPIVFILLVLLIPENVTPGNESGKGWAFLGFIYMLPFFLVLDAFIIRSISLDEKAEKELIEHPEIKALQEAEMKSGVTAKRFYFNLAVRIIFGLFFALLYLLIKEFFEVYTEQPYFLGTIAVLVLFWFITSDIIIKKHESQLKK